MATSSSSSSRASFADAAGGKSAGAQKSGGTGGKSGRGAKGNGGFSLEPRQKIMLGVFLALGIGAAAYHFWPEAAEPDAAPVFTPGPDGKPVKGPPPAPAPLPEPAPAEPGTEGFSPA